MTKQRKQWLDEKGQLLKGQELYEAKKSWKASDWEGYLKDSVEKPLREIPVGGPDEIALLSDRASEGYADLLEVEKSSFLSKKIEQGMKILTEREREVLYALFWEGLSQRGLAKSLELNRATVVVYQKRALEKLARYLIETASGKERT